MVTCLNEELVAPLDFQSKVDESSDRSNTTEAYVYHLLSTVSTTNRKTNKQEENLVVFDEERNISSFNDPLLRDDLVEKGNNIELKKEIDSSKQIEFERQIKDLQEVNNALQRSLETCRIEKDEAQEVVLKLRKELVLQHNQKSTNVDNEAANDAHTTSMQEEKLQSRNTTTSSEQNNDTIMTNDSMVCNNEIVYQTDEIDPTTANDKICNATIGDSDGASSQQHQAPGTGSSSRITEKSVQELSVTACDTMISLAEERLAQLDTLHEKLHPKIGFWTSTTIPTERDAAHVISQEVQAAVKIQMDHILQIHAVSKSTREVAAVIMAKTAAIGDQVNTSFLKHLNMAQKRLSQLQTILTVAQEKAAPVLTKLKDETTEALDAAIENFEEAIMKPDDHHCEDCCDFERESYGGYYSRSRYRRSRYDCDSEEDVCPEEECSGTECSCYKEDAEHDFSVILSAVKTLLTPIGTPTNPGYDCKGHNWETAISRLKAIDFVLKDWVENEVEAAEHQRFGEVCDECGKAWQTVALWISEEASVEQGLALHLRIITSKDNEKESYPPMSMLPFYHNALQLLETPCKLSTSVTESLDVSTLRLQRLFVEGRYTDALPLAKHSKLVLYQLKALTKVGTFNALATQFITCQSLTSKEIEDLVMFTSVGQPIDKSLQAKQQFLFLGAVLVQKSKEVNSNNADINIFAQKLMETAVKLKPTNVEPVLVVDADLESPSISRVFVRSIDLLKQDKISQSSLFAARLISLVAKEYQAISSFDSAGGTPFQATHPYETFCIVDKLVELKSKYERYSYHNISTSIIRNLFLMLNLANQTKDAALMKRALTVSEKHCTPKDMLSIGKHCLKVNNPLAAAKFAQRAYEAIDQSGIGIEAGAVINFMITLADDSNDILTKLIGNVKVSASSQHHGLLVTKLVQHLEHSNNPSLLADLRLFQLQTAKTLDTEENLNLMCYAVSAAIKVNHAAVTKVVSQISVCASTISIKTTHAQFDKYQMNRCFEEGKIFANDEIKKVQLIQERLLKVAEILVNYRDEATKVIYEAEKYPYILIDALLHLMRSSFEKIDRLTCRVNHMQMRTFCNRCVEMTGPIYKAAAVALYVSSAISKEHAVKTDKILKGLINVWQKKYKLKSLSAGMLHNFCQLVSHSPLTGYTAPQFTGFIQHPVIVTNWDCDAKVAGQLSSVKFDMLPRSASATEAGVWVCNYLRKYTTLDGVKCDKAAAVCDDEALDGAVLLSMNEEDLRQVFELGLDLTVDLQEWFAVRSLSLAINGEKHALSNRHQIQWSCFYDCWLREFSLDMTLLKSIDSGIICSLADTEVDTICAFLAKKGRNMKATEALSTKLRALRNVLRHASTSDIISIPERCNPFTVVVVGGTGAGKSTMLNALIGEAVLLPTNCMRACTATIIEMSYLASAHTGEAYVARVEYFTIEEWVTELRLMCATISAARNEFQLQQAYVGTDADAKSTGWVVDGTPSSDAVIKLRSVFGHASEDNIIAGNFDVLQGDQRVKEILSKTTVQLAANSAQELSMKLGTEVDSGNDTSDGARWPLIKLVAVKGPWATLMGGIRLVDTPGLHDDNSARANVVHSYLRNADSICLVSNIKRAVNDKVTKDLMTLELRKTLLTKGKLGQLVFVATQTDELIPSEIRNNLHLKESSSPTECAAARNIFTKAKLTDDFYIGVESRLRPINRNKASNVSFEFPVFTVSSVDFQKLSGIRNNDGAPKTFQSEQATEIPALRNFLKVVSAQHAQDHSSWGNLSGQLILNVVEKKSIASPTSNTTSAEKLSDVRTARNTTCATTLEVGTKRPHFLSRGQELLNIVEKKPKVLSTSNTTSIESKSVALSVRNTTGSIHTTPRVAKRLRTSSASMVKQPYASLAAIPMDTSQDCIDLCGIMHTTAHVTKRLCTSSASTVKKSYASLAAIPLDMSKDCIDLCDYVSSDDETICLL